MKKAIILIGCFMFINSITCFSLSDSKDKKVIKSNIYTVYGYLNNRDIYYLTIGFEKVINFMDTRYYMVLGLSSPSSEYSTDICFNKADSIKILAENGNFVDIKMTDMDSFIETEKLTNYPRGANVLNHYIVLRLEVTKEDLIKISLEPFYRIIFPYFNCSTREYNYLKFEQPTLFTRRIFIQKIINSILNNQAFQCLDEQAKINDDDE